jgi:hypothetical protein
MAAVDYITPAAIPGFSAPLTMDDMKRSHEVYNGLPHIETRYKEEIDRDAVHGLLGIILRHGLGHLVGVHNLHRHDPLPTDTVRIEKDIGHLLAGARMTPPVPLDRVDLGNTHALTYHVEGNKLVPFEFGEGQHSVPAGVITTDFMDEFTTFVAQRGLAEVFAVEIGDFTIQPRQAFKEVEIDKVGTIVVPSETLALSGPSIETAWDIRGYNEGNSDNDGTTSHQYSNVTKTHKVFTHKLDQGPKAVIDDLFELGVLKKPRA